MRRRNRNNIYISFLVVAIFSASLGYVLGYYTNNRQPRISEIEYNNEDNRDQENNSNSNEEDINNERPVASQNEAVNEETKLILRTFYERSNETEDKETSVHHEMIGLNETAFNEYILENMSQYDLVSFSKEEIVLLEKIDQVFPGHFLITEKNGFVVVYQYNDQGERLTYKETNIPISILPPVDKEKLKDGIIKKTVQEVTSLLEDYS